MIDYSRRALVVLAAYDYESLQLTLTALEHTVSKEETIVVVLNGKNNYAAAQVERVARQWATANIAKHIVVQPLCAGREAYFALQEIIGQLDVLKDREFICKIDDDLIPLKQGWLDKLAAAYEAMEEQHPGKVGFTTGLINNNCWGFKQLVALYNKQQEYATLNRYVSFSGEGDSRTVAAGQIDDGICGTVWRYPYLAWWIHQWTSLLPENMVATTAGLGLKEIPLETHYSIGCIFLKRSLWLSLEEGRQQDTFDELLLQRKCLSQALTKWAVMDEPMLHLFYFVQRNANKELITPLATALQAFYKDDRFATITRMTVEDRIIIQHEGLSSDVKHGLKHSEQEIVRRIREKSLSGRWKTFKRKVGL